MVIQPVQVKAAWLYTIDNGLMVAARATFERHDAFVWGNNMHLHRVGQRRPDQELAATGPEVGRTKRDIKIHTHLLLCLRGVHAACSRTERLLDARRHATHMGV